MITGFTPGTPREMAKSVSDDCAGWLWLSSAYGKQTRDLMSLTICWEFQHTIEPASQPTYKPEPGYLAAGMAAMVCDMVAIYGHSTGRRLVQGIDRMTGANLG